MSISFLLPFLFASPPQTATCAARGTPVIEIREGSDTSKRVTTTSIFATGAWTITAGRRVIESGCFERAELREIRRAMNRAPWDITQSQIACFAFDPSFTQYVIRGELRYTHRMCSGKIVDNVSLRAMDLLSSELAEERAEHAAPPVTTPPPPVSPMPPVARCAATGTPMFEMRHRSDAREATSTIALHASGAWTFQPIDADGRLGALSTGCLDKSTMQSLRSVIEQSPWDTTTSQITCRAYSPRFTEYFVHGRHEYTARLCGAQRLDDKSLGAIEIIKGELAKVTPAR